MSFSRGQNSQRIAFSGSALRPSSSLPMKSVSALDVSGCSAVPLELLKELAGGSSGVCLSFISHDMAVLKIFQTPCRGDVSGPDREMGTRTQIFSNPQSRLQLARLNRCGPIPRPDIAGDRYFPGWQARVPALSCQGRRPRAPNTIDVAMAWVAPGPARTIRRLEHHFLQADSNFLISEILRWSLVCQTGVLFWRPAKESPAVTGSFPAMSRLARFAPSPTWSCLRWRRPHRPATHLKTPHRVCKSAPVLQGGRS